MVADKVDHIGQFVADGALVDPGVVFSIAPEKKNIIYFSAQNVKLGTHLLLSSLRALAFR